MADRLSRFVPVTLEADLGALPPGARRALPHLERAVRGIDALFQRQLGPHVGALAQRIEAEGLHETDEGRAFRYFNGPYDTLADYEPFFGAPPLPPGKALYPANLTKDEVDAYLAAHPEEKDALLDPYTVVVRDGDRLRAVPYHEAFAAELAPVVDALRAAAAEVEHEGLAEFLRGRAAAFTGEGDLLESNADWVRLSGAPLEVVIGPFEVYADHLLGQKSFYEAMLLQIDQDACARLDAIERALPELAAAIPVPDGATAAVGGMAPLVVADELLTGGDAHSGLSSSAFNLPNDPSVRATVGWKQVMIRNMMRAKFQACTRPIAERVLSPEDFAATSFDAYFYHVLLHEVSHGLGPAYRADGRKASEACGRLHTPLEEAKADTGSLNLLLRFTGRFGIPELSQRAIGTSYFAGLFRSVRFGLHEAHGRANVIQYTYLRERGAIRERDGRWGVDTERLVTAAAELLAELTHLQAAGTELELTEFVEKYGTPPEELVQIVASLTDLPVDVRPTFSLET